MYEIEYYEDEKGNKPVEQFIDDLDAKMKAKVFGRLELLEDKGSLLECPFRDILAMESLS